MTPASAGPGPGTKAWGGTQGQGIATCNPSQLGTLVATIGDFFPGPREAKTMQCPGCPTHQLKPQHEQGPCDGQGVAQGVVDQGLEVCRQEGWDGKSGGGQGARLLGGRVCVLPQIPTPKIHSAGTPPTCQHALHHQPTPPSTESGSVWHSPTPRMVPAEMDRMSRNVGLWMGGKMVKAAAHRAQKRKEFKKDASLSKAPQTTGCRGQASAHRRPKLGRAAR
jgi:hypothetical protein